PYDIFNLLDVVVGQFNARAGRSFDIDDELARVGSREEGDTHKGNQQKAGREKDQESSHCLPGPVQRSADPFFIEIQHHLKLGIKCGMKPSYPGFAGLCLAWSGFRMDL